MTTLAHIASLVLNRPLLITPSKAEVLLAILGNRLGVEAPDAQVTGPDASRFVGEPFEKDANGNPVKRLSFLKTPDGVANISVVGSLVNRGAYLGSMSGVVSYEGIQHQLRAAAADKSVKAIVLDMHTPGGECIGCFETASLVREITLGGKRVVAVVNGMAASAGYAIASGASSIVTTDTGGSGSIGVVLLHADYSARLHNEGIKVTLIYAGEGKVDGNPYQPLTDKVHGDLKTEVESFYAKFLQTVEAGRGARLTSDMARTLGAHMKFGGDAVEAGLADEVGTFESAMTIALTGYASRTTHFPSMARSKTMNTQDENIPRAEHDAAVAASRTRGEEAGRTAGHTAGVTAGAAAERLRCVSIMTSEHAAGREAQAIVLLGTDLTAEAAVKVLAASPKAAPAAPQPPANRSADAAGGLVLAGGTDAAAQAGETDFDKGAAIAKRYGGGKAA